MPIYQATDPETGDTLKVEGDTPPTDADLGPLFAKYRKKKASEPSAAGAFARSAVMGIAPAAGAWKGAEAGALTAAAIPGVGETGVAELIGGGVGALIGSVMADKAQREALKLAAPEIHDTLQSYQQEDLKKHPFATAAGSVASSLPVFEATPFKTLDGAAALVKIARGTEVTKAEKEAATALAIQTGFGAGVGIVAPLVQGQKPTAGEITQGIAQAILFGKPLFGKEAVLKPALKVGDQIVTGGDSHDEVAKNAPDPEAAQEALKDDANHVFNVVGQNGEIVASGLSREEAAPIYDQIQGNPPGKTKELHSTTLRKVTAPEAETPTQQLYREAEEAKKQAQAEYPPVHQQIVDQTGLSKSELDALGIPSPEEVTHPTDYGDIPKRISRNAPGGYLNRLYDKLAGEGKTGKFIWGGTAENPKIGFEPDVANAKPDVEAAQKALTAVNKIRGVFGFDPLPNFFSQPEVEAAKNEPAGLPRPNADVPASVANVGEAAPPVQSTPPPTKEPVLESPTPEPPISEASKPTATPMAESVPQKGAGKPFEVDDQLVMRSPRTGEDVIVSYRGKPSDGNAVVWTGKTQMQIPEAWLRRQGEKYVEPEKPAEPAKPAVEPTRKPATPAKRVESLSKGELINELVGEAPADYAGKTKWENYRKAYARFKRDELIYKVNESRRLKSEGDALNARSAELYPQIKEMAEKAGSKWRQALKEHGEQNGVQTYMPSDFSRDEVAFALARNIAGKQLAKERAKPVSEIPTPSEPPISEASKPTATPTAESVPQKGAGESPKPLRASDKSVRDLPVSGTRKGDTITIAPKGAPTKLTFSAADLANKTEWERKELLEKQTAHWDDEPGGAGQAARLRDSVRAVMRQLVEPKQSLQDRIDANRKAQQLSGKTGELSEPAPTPKLPEPATKPAVEKVEAPKAQEAQPSKAGDKGKGGYSFGESDVRVGKVQVSRKVRPNGDDITSTTSIDAPIDVTDSKNWPSVNPDHLRYEVFARGKFEERQAPKKAEKVWRVYNPKTKETVATGLSFNDAVDFAKTEMVRRNFEKPEPTQPIPQGPGAKTSRESGTVYTPGEKPETYEATGLKHDIDEFERAVYGFPEAEPAEKRAMIPQWVKSGEAIKKDPTLPERIVSELVDNPRRALTDEDSAVLLRYKVSIENALNDAASRTFSKDMAEAGAASLEVAVLRDKLETFLDAVRERGSEWGREGRWRQALAKEDYSFATQERLMRAAKGGAELTDKERTDLMAQLTEHKKIHDQITKELAEKEQKIVALESQRAIDEAFRRENPPVEPHVRLIADKVKGFFDTQGESALARFKARRAGTTKLYNDPTAIVTLGKLSTEDLMDLSVYGASKILAGGIKSAEMAADWAAEMKAEIGDYITPHLKEIWEASKKAIDDQVNKMVAGEKGPKPPVERVKKAVKELTPEQNRERIKSVIKKRVAEGKVKSIAPFVGRLMRNLVESGVSDRDELFKQVHAFMQEVMPEITEYETKKIMSGYGEYSSLPKDEVSKKLRDLRGQLQLVLQAEDLQQGRPRLKTGQERREVTLEQRRLQKIVNDLNREFQVPLTDPERQLKSPLDTLKNRMQNRIDDLQEVLDKGEFKKRPEKPPLRLDERAIELQGKLREIERKIRDARTKLELQNRSFSQRFVDFLNNFHRLGVISGLTTLGKLAIAGQGRIGSTLADTTAGLFLNKAPFIRDIAEGAPREGLTGEQPYRKLAKGYVKGWQYAANQAAKVITKGQSRAEEAAKAKNIYDAPLGRYIFYLHALLKLPAFSHEYQASLLYRMEAALKAKGNAPLTPMEELAVNNAAVADGLRAKFSQDNILTKRLQMVLRSLDKSKEHPTSARIIANTIRFIMPVAHIPTNVAAEGMAYTNLGLGLPRAAIKTFAPSVKAAVENPRQAYTAAMQAFEDNIKNLTPEQKDSIMRHWKKGALGAGLMLLGYYNADKIGGYYQPGKQDPKKPQFGGIQMFGYNIPRWVIHLPIFEPIHFGATIRHVQEHMTKKTHERGGLAEGITAGVAGMLDEVPYVSNAANVTEALKGGGQGDYARGQLVKSAIVPRLVSEIAEWADKDRKRKTSGVVQAVESGIPGLRQNLPLK